MKQLNRSLYKLKLEPPEPVIIDTPVRRVDVRYLTFDPVEAQLMIHCRDVYSKCNVELKVPMNGLDIDEALVLIETAIEDVYLDYEACVRPAILNDEEYNE